jgi:(p)ppGpp synthase/HD superfamily hydrolase
MDSMCIKALELAEKAYPKKKLQHAIRVANYAVQIAELDSRCETRTYLNTNYVFVVAILHDIVEDTEVPLGYIQNEFDVYVSEAVELLTKPEDVEYKDYIENLVQSGDILAYWVKKADMKDHMAQTATLTEKLVNKYAPVLHYFI